MDDVEPGVGDTVDPVLGATSLCKVVCGSMESDDEPEFVWEEATTVSKSGVWLGDYALSEDPSIGTTVWDRGILVTNETRSRIVSLHLAPAKSGTGCRLQAIGVGDRDGRHNRCWDVLHDTEYNAGFG